MSRETGIDESVIRFICNEEYRKTDHAIHPVAPEVLGIDELTLDGELRFIAIDVLTKQTLDIRKNCDTDTIETWLFLMRNKENVRVVTQDMRDQYRQIVKRKLPGAVIVVDRWHTQKKANDALDHVRSRHRKIEAEKEKKRIQEELERKGVKPKTRKEKDPWRLRRVLQQSRKKHKPTTILLLDGLFKNNPLLSDAWHTKESFYDIWDAKNREEAERLFDEWRKCIPESVKVEFDSVAATIDYWHDEVFAYFDHRYTNALTEAINGLIKMVNRGGRGYTYKNIRAKALRMVPIGDTRKAKREAKAAAKKATEARGVFACESCLGKFDAGLKQLSPSFSLDGGPERRLALCPKCRRVSTFARWLERSGAHVISHLKNG
jgi:transposase